MEKQLCEDGKILTWTSKLHWHGGPEEMLEVNPSFPFVTAPYILALSWEEKLSPYMTEFSANTEGKRLGDKIMLIEEK